MTDLEDDLEIKTWKIKNLIKKLESAKGNGTSMISLILPPKDQIHKWQAKLQTELGTASNIKARVNRQSVLSAIISAKNILSNYSNTSSQVPKNGLVIFTGAGKPIVSEPFKPINTSLYVCDSKFHTKPLLDLIKSDQKYGYIVIDGNGTLFGTLTGNVPEILYRFSVELPKKHGRGGQSALRFARLRKEKRNNYVKKVAELAVRFFITNDCPNVSGLVMAGSADLKEESKTKLDQRLQAIILATIPISYGGENGFNQAIKDSEETISSNKSKQDQKPLTLLLSEIAKESNKYVFGLEDTIKALFDGLVETLIVLDNFDRTKYNFKCDETNITLDKEIKEWESNGKDIKSECDEFLGWLADNYKKFGCALKFVTDKTLQGEQFKKGLGGIGGLLRYSYIHEANNQEYENILSSDEKSVEKLTSDLDFI